MSAQQPDPPTDGVYVNIGFSGSGKTHTAALQQMRGVAAGRRIATCDRLYEWQTERVELLDTFGIADVSCEIGSVDELDDATAEGYRFIVLPGPYSIEDADAMCAWALQADVPKERRDQRGAAFPEAHRVFPNNGAELEKSAPAFNEALTAWRHHFVAVWADAQRLSKLHTDITELATETRVFAVAGRLEKKRLLDIAEEEDDGARLVELATEANRRRRKAKDLKDAGAPASQWVPLVGWHVHVQSPPYELIRL